MKGYIAFCPHFHQPHFQLYKTREEAYYNSYQPWLELLQEAVGLNKFYINLHFSGPFLYWFQDKKKSYMEEVKRLIAGNKIGIVGGLADEPFIQLSSRGDDYLYQLKKYDELCCKLTGVKATEWQGIHLVERECGEALLAETSRAAKLLGAQPVYYLDAETFYPSHYATPGGAADYCLKHFGFKDPFSLTTISHIPEEMLYFALRDEIHGQEYYSLPVHTQYRYQLLKRNGFTGEDRTRIKPAHYLFYIKDSLEKAYQLAAQYGRQINPIVLIFEDAEKMGQWSKDPAGDKQWLMEFFKLVERDEELEFTGLRNYIELSGFLDSYPVYSSHSYPEWENWTAKRGIRGVTFGDERLRRVISCLRILEEEQDNFEKTVLASPNSSLFPEGLQDMLTRAILQSAERYEIVCHLLKINYSSEISECYALINRVRNLLYQEDPKWASRHPCYGSSPYYDMQGLAYLEICQRLLEYLHSEISGQPLQSSRLAVRDWDFDGQDEVVFHNSRQTMAIDLTGGCVHYHHVLSPGLMADNHKMADILVENFTDIKAYHAVYRYAYPLVMTEADSSLKHELFAEGARKENCRNSLRCELIINKDGEYSVLGDLAQAQYSLEEVNEEPDCSLINLSCVNKILYGEMIRTVKITKQFVLFPDKLRVTIKAGIDGEPVGNIYLVPQIVSSAAPSDEIEFRPVSYIGFPEDQGNTEISIQDIVVQGKEGCCGTEHQLRLAEIKEADYVFYLKGGDGNAFSNRISYRFAGSPIERMEIKPAVKHYYENLVFAEQSRLGYHSSGIMLMPYIALNNGEAEFTVDISWELDCQVKEDDYQQSVKLIQS